MYWTQLEPFKKYVPGLHAGIEHAFWRLILVQVVWRPVESTSQPKYIKSWGNLWFCVFELYVCMYEIWWSNCKLDFSCINRSILTIMWTVFELSKCNLLVQEANRHPRSNASVTLHSATFLLLFLRIFSSDFLTLLLVLTRDEAESRVVCEKRSASTPDELREKSVQGWIKKREF